MKKSSSIEKKMRKVETNKKSMDQVSTLRQSDTIAVIFVILFIKKIYQVIAIDISL